MPSRVPSSETLVVTLCQSSNRKWRVADVMSGGGEVNFLLSFLLGWFSNCVLSSRYGWYSMQLLGLSMVCLILFEWWASKQMDSLTPEQRVRIVNAVDEARQTGIMMMEQQKQDNDSASGKEGGAHISTMALTTTMPIEAQV